MNRLSPQSDSPKEAAKGGKDLDLNQKGGGTAVEKSGSQGSGEPQQQEVRSTRQFIGELI